MSTNTEDLSQYLYQIADRLEAKLEDVTTNVSKKLDEVSKKIDHLEKSRKQMEDATVNDKDK
ncbi:hypothetical protein BDB01DRAFT_845491 [Pilobolus umbonatus]|nr:hypothetical protein BDB01DRAFT_845491 [Pilobolus umbonatus]